MINSRIRDCINSRLYWSDLLVTRIIACPAPYATGTVNTTQYSAIVTGNATSWPVTDKVNTTSTVGVQDTGYQEITPSSMNNIGVDTMLYCDAGGSEPETVAVVETTPTSFWASFKYAHNTGFTMTTSSLAGLQIDFGENYPKYTIRGVHDAQTLEMDNPWGAPSIATASYQILLILATIDPNLKLIVDCVDQLVGRRIAIYAPVERVNQIDPQRSSTGDPLALIQHTPSEAGTMRYEIYPQVTEARMLTVFCGLQWPELKLDTDRPPYFIDPNLFVEGAIADALRVNNPRGPMGSKDPWFNPQVAMEYERKFMAKLQLAVNADEAKCQRAWSHKWEELFAASGAQFWQQHDPDINAWAL